MKRRTMDIMAGIGAGCISAAACYMFLNNKKNMLDVIIEEIETIK